jgi:hypothetical protein
MGSAGKRTAFFELLEVSALGRKKRQADSNNWIATAANLLRQKTRPPLRRVVSGHPCPKANDRFRSKQS